MSERCKHESSAPPQRLRCRSRTHAATKDVLAFRARASTNAGLDPRVATHLLVARCAFAGIVSYDPVGRLAPADGRRSLCSPEMVEAGLRFAMEGSASADRR